MIIKNIDIFCEIIDNYGDIGVVYRISKELKKLFQNVKIRVVLNRLDEFMAINKSVKDEDYQEIQGITYIKEEYFKNNIDSLGVAELFIEAFGCDIFDEYIEIAKQKSKLWINLEYLSGEKWIEDFHLQESLLNSKTLKKIFYMPGFSEKSGGVIIDSGFLERKNKVLGNEKNILNKYIFKDRLDLKKYEENNYKNLKIGTVFSYEKNFTNLLKTLENQEFDTILILMGDKTQKSFLNILDESYTKDYKKNSKKSLENFDNIIKCGKITMVFSDFLSQEEYEEVISSADFNFTRGEDSFVRSILLGSPFMWHIYLQEDKAHMDKILAFAERFSESVNNQENNNKKILENYSKLLADYNDRKTNSLEIGRENFDDFFENFDEYKRVCKIYSEFLLENCNLVKKLYNYIQEY